MKTQRYTEKRVSFSVYLCVFSPCNSVLLFL